MKIERNFFSYDNLISAQNLALTTDITENQIRQAERKFNILDLWSGNDLAHGICAIMKEPDFCFWAARHLLNHNITPQHAIILAEMWKRPFPMLIATRGWSKTYSNAMLAILKMRMEPGTRIVGVGSSFRQSKLIWEYMKFIWEKAEVLQSTCDKRNDGPKMHTDRATFRIGDSLATFIPIGVHGDKIRGLRATAILIDEFDSLNIDIYEKVIVGFGAVTKDPVMNAVIAARRKRMIAGGEWSNKLEKHFGTQEINQQIITGTAGFGFGHFCKYWERYRDIIYGTTDKIAGLDEEVDMDESRHNYSIIRIHANMVPEGFLDAETINRARASMIPSNFNMEYMATFAKDSEGFFRRSLINACTVTQQEPVVIGGEGIYFAPRLTGDSAHQYIFGIDPAFAQDNLSIAIIECHPTHNRIVHVWSINEERFRAKVKAGIVDQHDYFQYCARKVRDLMTVFNCSRIMMDSQGGGYTLAEIFANPSDEKEPKILEIVEEGKSKVSDGIAGLHILELCNFANQKWLTSANHGMKADFENKMLLFPEYDYVELAAASIMDNYNLKKAGLDLDKIDSSIYDTLEDVYLEIEELKKELCSIIHSRTVTGVERWNTPELSSKGKSSKKDRYCALLMANKAARDKAVTLVSPPRYSAIGYAVGDSIVLDKTSKTMYNQDWASW